MALSIDWNTLVITVPQSDLTFISGTLYELDTEAFRQELHSIMAAEVGMPFVDSFRHNTEVTVAGVTYARTIEIINGFQIEFEDGQYAVRLVGSNNNLFDEGVLVRNQVSVIPTNSAGLIRTEIPAQLTQSHMEVAYDGTTLRLGVWLDRLGVTVLSPVSCQVDWYNPDGTLLFTVSDSSPDARGHFEINQVQALVNNTAYYADVSVTDAEGTISVRRGVPTVGS